MFSRVIVGARDVLITAPLVALLCVSVGTLLGLAAGYMRGWVDDVISRVMEAVLAIPVILIGLVVLTNFGTSRYAMSSRSRSSSRRSCSGRCAPPRSPRPSSTT